jgi:5-methylcytosine-specific restriction endonuclease McrA
MGETAIRSRRDTGDVQTGDGIERASQKPRDTSHPTPCGGEGGSVLQALGSKEERRKRRRQEKKEAYALYLKSSTWKKIRAAALTRDRHTCRACGRRAEVVHHIRYPAKLGQEKMEWLYSLCARCHDEIHRRATTTTLRKATHHVLGSPAPSRKKKRKKTKRQDELLAAKLKELENWKPKMKQPAKGKKKRMSLAAENDRLHSFFTANRARRAANGKRT